MQRIEIIYELDSQEPSNIWEKIAHILESIGDQSALSLYGKKVKLTKLPAEIKKLKGKGFNIESDSFAFHMATITNYEQILLQIDSKQCLNNWWSIWINEFSNLKGFVQAWLVDVEFNYWQNASDPIEYEYKGRSYEGLPMKSNGLPPPLEQLEIDTSNNAGLRKLCDGYVQAIGAKMWLSDKFLNLTGKDIKSIANIAAANIEQLESGVYKLNMSTELFVDESSLEEQKKLREALYS